MYLRWYDRRVYEYFLWWAQVVQELLGTNEYLEAELRKIFATRSISFPVQRPDACRDVDLPELIFVSILYYTEHYCNLLFSAYQLPTQEANYWHIYCRCMQH